MGSRRHVGAGLWEFIGILAVLAIAAGVISYLTQKPQKPRPVAVVIQDDAPPPAPAPAPAPVVEAAPPPPPVVKPAQVVVAPPPPPLVPACVPLEARLRAAQKAADQAAGDIAAEKAARIERVRTSDAYKAAQEDLDVKRKAKDAAVEQVRQDDETLHDPTDDRAAMQAAMTAWLGVSSNLIQMETDAVAADPAIAEKQNELKQAQATIADAQAQLSDYIHNDMTTISRNDRCPVQDVKLDASTWTINASLKPAPLAQTGAMADMALNEIGKILEKSLRQSAFNWNSAVFTVYFDFNGNPVVEFRTIYSRSAVQQANFAAIDHNTYMEDQSLVNLAQDFWLSPLINQMQNGVHTIGYGSGLPAEHRYPDLLSQGTYTDTLFIGGFTRVDGSACPLITISRPHSSLKFPTN